LEDKPKLKVEMQSVSDDDVRKRDHTVLPATQHKWTHPALTPARHAGTRFTYPGGTKGRVDLGDWLHTEMMG